MSMALIAVAVTAAFFVASRVIKADIERLKLLEIYSKKFRDHARPLLRDYDTPVEVLEDLQFLNDMMGKSEGARIVIISFTIQRVTSDRTQKKNSRLTPFFVGRPELKESYSKAIAAGIVSTTYGSLVFGPMARRAIDRYLSKHPEDAEALVGTLSSDRHHHNGLAAA